jgi:hypothetical protein
MRKRRNPTINAMIRFFAPLCKVVKSEQHDIIRFCVAVLLTILIIMLFSCTTPVQYVTKTEVIRVKDTVVKIQPPPILDTLNAYHQAEINALNNIIDSVRVGLRMRGRDTMVYVKYYPRRDTFTVYARPDTVSRTVTIRDTVRLEASAPPAQTVKQGLNFWEWIQIACVFAVFSYGIVWFYTKRGSEE